MHKNSRRSSNCSVLDKAPNTNRSPKKFNKASTTAYYTKPDILDKDPQLLCKKQQLILPTADDLYYEYYGLSKYLLSTYRDIHHLYTHIYIYIYTQVWHIYIYMQQRYIHIYKHITHIYIERDKNTGTFARYDFTTDEYIHIYIYIIYI